MPPKRPLVKGGKLTPKVDLNPSDLEEISVSGFGKAAEQVLENFGWTGLAAATVGLSLAGDNKRILETNFFLHGKLFEDETQCWSTRAARFWPDAPETYELRIPFDDLGAFRFDGDLCSALVPSQAISYKVFNTEDNAEVPLETFRDDGGGDFVLRAFVHMKTTIWCKVIMALIPWDKDRLLETYNYATDRRFPGLRVTSFEAAILPNSSKAFGLPFYPLLQKGSKDKDFPSMSSFEIRKKVHQLLQKGLVPRITSDLDKLESKLKQFSEEGPEALADPTSVFPHWPEALPSPGDQDSSESQGEGKKGR